MAKRGLPLVDRPEWSEILVKIEKLNQSGLTRHKIRLAIQKEFGINESVLHQAIQRGDVPSLPSNDFARVQARHAGETKYHDEPCKYCGATEKWVASRECVQCEQERRREADRRRKKLTG